MRQERCDLSLSVFDSLQELSIIPRLKSMLLPMCTNTVKSTGQKSGNEDVVEYCTE
ncbi:hypothetical protein HORM4_130086 [Vibrio harveyi]|nr:hypothetical protein HORM4_130086 [Vibrio harveyi]